MQIIKKLNHEHKVFLIFYTLISIYMATVGVKELKSIKPGTIEAFHCDGAKMFAVAAAISTLKRRGMPEGVANYEHKKFFEKKMSCVALCRNYRGSCGF